MFDILAFIEQKRDGKVHDSIQIENFVRGCMDGSVPDYQIAAWLMAVYFRSLNSEELISFTRALADSGDKIVFPEDMVVLDKHSTGGVGDKTTLIVIPIVSSLGVPIAKLSGRGLGFTGGTIDKLSSIPGISLQLEAREFINQVMEIGCAISGHSKALAPAEGFFYALRDVTGTVPSIPLIASSIVSKKLAGGANRFVFDVKFGNGAFMKKKDESIALAETLVGLAKAFDKKALALLTNMNAPLGRWVGNSAEVQEALDILRGDGPQDTRNLCLSLSAAMLLIADRVKTMEEGIACAQKAIESGKALRQFKKLIEFQKGRLSDAVLAGEEMMPLAGKIAEVKSDREGYITACNALNVGLALRKLGGGRMKKGENIDLTVAIELLKKTKDHVDAKEPMARIYFNNENSLEEALNLIRDAFVVGEAPPSSELLVERIIGID